MIKRRTFLQGIAAGFAAILTPFKVKAAEPVRTTGYLRVVNEPWKWLSGDLNPATHYGSFNKFLNTPYQERMSFSPTMGIDPDVEVGLNYSDANGPSRYCYKPGMKGPYKGYYLKDDEWLKQQIQCERNEVPRPLGPDKRQRWVDAMGYPHDHHLRNQIIEAIKAHKPFVSPFDGGAHTGA